MESVGKLMAASLYIHEEGQQWSRKAYLGDKEPTSSEGSWKLNDCVVSAFQGW